jgi:hypothetical protein
VAEPGDQETAAKKKAAAAAVAAEGAGQPEEPVEA